MYYDEEDYYEPSAADMVLDEFKEKMKEVLLGTVKQEIESVKEENERLKEENKNLKERESKVYWKEQELKSKENQLEYLFYRKKFSDLINPLLENYIGYYVETKYRKPNKCDQCNEDRKIIYKSDSGKTIEKTCDCNINESYYAPRKTEIERLSLWKNERDNELSITPRYEYHSEDDERWSRLELENVIDKFDISEAEDINQWRTVFSCKEECQKYCDYLNTKESN